MSARDGAYVIRMADAAQGRTVTLPRTSAPDYSDTYIIRTVGTALTRVNGLAFPPQHGRSFVWNSSAWSTIRLDPIHAMCDPVYASAPQPPKGTVPTPRDLMHAHLKTTVARLAAAREDAAQYLRLLRTDAQSVYVDLAMTLRERLAAGLHPNPIHEEDRADYGRYLEDVRR